MTVTIYARKIPPTVVFSEAVAFAQGEALLAHATSEDMLLGTIDDLVAIPAGPTSVALTWTPVANATSYQPQYRTPASTGSYIDFGSPLDGSADEVTVTGLIGETEYGFRVVASDGATTTFSNVATAVPSAGETPHTDLLFQSSWDTLGNNSAALTDGGKWTNVTAGPDSAVVPTASTGRAFPTPNVFAANWSGGGSETLSRYDSWTFPEIGESRGFRWYKSVEIPDAYVNFVGADHQNHPIQDSLPLASTGHWTFIVRTFAGITGQWLPRFNTPTDGWLLDTVLEMGVPYRFECLLTRISETEFDFAVRVYAPPLGGWTSGAVGILIHDSFDFDGDGSTNLGTHPTNPINTTSMSQRGITAGTNGWNGDGAYSGGNFVCWYDAAFAVHTTWPGPYITGERQAE